MSLMCCNGPLCAIAAQNSFKMNDVDYVRITAMLILPECLKRSANPIKDAVDYAEELLKECQKRENSQ